MSTGKYYYGTRFVTLGGDDTEYVMGDGTLSDGSGLNQTIGTDDDLITSGATVVDDINLTDGVVTAHSTRTLTLADLGWSAPDLSGYLLNTTDTFTGTLTVDGKINGNGQQLVLNAGESYNYPTGQTNEFVYINAESGLQINSSPDNWGTGWAGRKTTTINDTSGNSTFANDITVSGGDITLGGTGRITGVDTVSAATDAANKAYVDTRTPFDHIRSLGTIAITNGTSPSINTAQLISEIEQDGAFDSYTSVFKTSWSYGGNYDLTDAGRFTETAGTSWITWTDNSSDTTRGNITALAIAPTTGGSAGKVFIYNDQGSSYSPGWREVWTSTSDGAGSGLDADKLDAQEGTYYLDYNNFTNTPSIPGAYEHPTHAGDDINIDTGALSGAVVISDLDFNVTTNGLGHVTDANGTVSTRTLTLANLGYTGDINANEYLHPTFNGDDFSLDTGALTGATVISDLDINVTTNAEGHVTDANGTVATRTLTLANLGYTGDTNANEYVHPTYSGDDMGIDTGALSGAVVISDIDLNVSTDTLGHVTDANATIGTRTLTLANLGYTGDTNANNSTPRTDEQIRDVAAAQWIDGTNTTVVKDDAANTIKINASGGGSSLWSTDTNGITYSGRVGINANSITQADLKVGSGGILCEGNSKVSGDLDLSGDLSVQNGAGTAGQYLTVGINGSPYWTTLTSPGGSLSIGSNATDVFSASSSTLSGVDAGANKIMYWDNTNNKLTYLGIGNNLSISGGNLNASGSGGGTGDITAVTAGDGLTGGGTSGAVTLAANVGAGLTTSSDKIIVDNTVVRTSGAQSIADTKTFTGTVSLNGGGRILDYQGGQGVLNQVLTSRAGSGVEWKTISTGGSSVWTEGSGTVYINSSDKLGVNTSSPDGWIEVSKKTSSGSTPTLLLTQSDLTYSSSNDNFMTYKSRVAGGNTVYWHHGVDVSQNKFIINYSTSSTPFAPTTTNFTLTNAGNLVLEGTCTADNFILTSDERLKTDIRDVDYSDHIKADWKTFKMKDKDTGTRYGVIAQELEEHHPEFVDTDEEGYKSVKYIDLLVAKIAELEARLENLEK